MHDANSTIPEPRSSPREPLDAETTAMIRRRALQISRQPGFTPDDVEDLQQELTRRLLQQRDRFRIEIGQWPGFVATLLEGQGRNLVRDRWARKRRPFGVIPLGTICGVDDDGLPLSLEQTITIDARHQHSLDDAGQRDLQLEVEAALASLPRRLQDVASRLGHQGIAQIARDLHIPRTTVYSLLSRIRHRFEAAGLRDYLK